MTKGSADRDSFTHSQNSRSGMTSDDYLVGAWLVGGLSFIAIWLYEMVSWGLFLGFTFGWIPALIGGVILCLLWPLVLLAVIRVIILIWGAARQ